MWSAKGVLQWVGGLIVCLAMSAAMPAAADPVSAGGLEFSDELGGFELLSASGTGTIDDPIVLRQRLGHTDPVLLVVRVLDAIPEGGYSPSQGIYMRAAVSAIVVNDSRYPWIGFDFELQQERNKPSVYGDGLSFDQLGTFRSRLVRSDRFLHTLSAAEPYDRLRFREGTVDPGYAVEFDVNLLDVSPVREFYLLLHPQVPVS